MNVKPDFGVWASIKKEFEGCRLKAYQDTAKIWTIGFGATYNHNARRRVKENDTITYQDAINFMEIDAAETVRLANVYIKKPLNWHQSTAICDYIYNRGIGTFLKVEYNSWGLDELINQNPNDDRISIMLSETGWKDRLGNILGGLKRRRKCEAELYRSGNVIFK